MANIRMEKRFEDIPGRGGRQWLEGLHPFHYPGAQLNLFWPDGSRKVSLESHPKPALFLESRYVTVSA
jgi:hypothetical protein